MSTAVSTAPQASATPDFPKKLFYRIQEVAKISGLKPYVLRYWETQFKELRPEKDKSGQRRYRQNDIEMILRIQDLLHTRKYTIAGACKEIKRARQEKSAPKKVAPIPKPATVVPTDSLKNIRAELNDLLQLISA